ncbi:MAG TPA: hypothetical protein VFN64_09575 [Burkholderiaceae bacterium]|nr:hypothetical protein [Burkholderiaceae bacterium]
MQFVGTFKGQPFALYDWKGGRELHVGGNAGLDVDGLCAAVVAQLRTVAPTPYEATEHYDGTATHGWRG